MKTNFVKGLIAAIIAFIAGYVSQVDHVNYTYIIVYSVGFTLYYLGKNYVFPSKSPLGFIDVWDLVSGLTLAVGSAVIALAAQWITISTIDWHQIWVTVYTSAGGYLASKFGFGNKVNGQQSSQQEENDNENSDPPIPPKG